MNINKVIEKLEDTYKFEITCDKQIGNYYKFKFNYIDLIIFEISFRYEPKINEIQNLYMLSKEIESEILKFFYKE